MFRRRNDSLTQRLAVRVLAMVVVALLAAGATAVAQEGGKQQMLQKLREAAPGKGYVKAHEDLQEPQPLLGGPIEVSISQQGGTAFVALPDRRELDPRVFGTPDMPRSIRGTPAIYGVPPLARGVEDGEYTVFKQPSPFGDKTTTMEARQLQLQATDATATDAATTEDRVRFRASWEDEQGNTYEVRCCEKLATHGMEFPTFGGVVTNTILHGFSGIGTALMPSEYAYFAFWGMGEVRKNGEVMDKPRLIHTMLTEYVRTEGYELAFDEEVDPKAKHFHIMVAPFMPDPENLSYTQDPVRTGFTLPNGKQLPFWHVMFEDVAISSDRVSQR